MDVSVIIVNYNTCSLTRDCIRSVYEQTTGLSFEVIVADNASTDASRKILPGLSHENYRYLYNDENLGFSRANNRASELASGRFLFFMNSDMVLLNNVLGVLKAKMESCPGIGIAGPKFLNPDGSLQVSCRNFPSLLFGCLKFFPFLKRFLSGEQQAYYQGGRDYTLSQTVDTVSAGALFIRRDLFETVGRFDEASFMYAEDADICRQVRDRGLSVLFEPAAELIHYGGQSTRLNSERAVWAYYLAFYHLYKKYYFGPAGMILKPLFVLRAMAGLAANRFRADKRIPWRDK